MGMIMYRNNWFPVPQIRAYKIKQSSEHYVDPHLIGLLITKYQCGLPVFSDRQYYDIECDRRLDSSLIVQIPRHLEKPVRLKFTTDVIVYRLQTSSNDSKNFNGWKKTDIKLKVVGASCIHDHVFVKNFEPGEYEFNSGGSVSSSPILVKTVTKSDSNCLAVGFNF